MPFSPLIGISFVFHLVLALADVALSTRRKRKMRNAPERKRRTNPDFPSFVPEARTFNFGRITE